MYKITLYRCFATLIIYDHDLNLMISLGLASYTMGLFTDLSKSAYVSVTSIDIDPINDKVIIQLNNNGGTPVTLEEVEINGRCKIYCDSKYRHRSIFHRNHNYR